MIYTMAGYSPRIVSHTLHYLKLSVPVRWYVIKLESSWWQIMCNETNQTTSLLIYSWFVGVDLYYDLLTKVTLVASTRGLPRGGTIMYHLLASRKAIMANSSVPPGITKAAGKQECSPKQPRPDEGLLLFGELNM